MHHGGAVTALTCILSLNPCFEQSGYIYRYSSARANTESEVPTTVCDSFQYTVHGTVVVGQQSTDHVHRWIIGSKHRDLVSVIVHAGRNRYVSEG